MVPRNVVSVPRLSFYLHFRLHNSVCLCNRVARRPLALLCDPTRMRARRTTIPNVCLQNTLSEYMWWERAGHGRWWWMVSCVLGR